MGILFTMSRGSWVGLAVGMVIWVALIWRIQGGRALGRTLLIIGAAATVALAAIALPSVQRGTGEDRAVGYHALSSLAHRAQSAFSDTSANGIRGRTELWQRSLHVALDRPWFEDQRPWAVPVRHLFGYGPDTLIYALPLRRASDEADPVNASAHNYPIQMTVEIGALGAVTYLAFVSSLAIAGASALLRHHRRLGPALSLVYASLLASVVVRITEQLTGVARVSDLMLFSAIAALIVATSALVNAETGVEADNPTAKSTSRSHTRTTPRPTIIWVRLSVALAAVLLGTTLITLIWQKNVAYAHAAALGAASAQAFQRGDLETSLVLVDRARSAAPDVEQYHLQKATILASGEMSGEVDPVDLARRRYALTKEARGANRLSHTAVAAAAGAALELASLGDQTAGLDSYLSVTDASDRSAGALYVEGLAHQQMGFAKEAASSFRASVRADPDGPFAEAASQQLAALDSGQHPQVPGDGPARLPADVKPGEP